MERKLSDGRTLSVTHRTTQVVNVAINGQAVGWGSVVGYAGPKQVGTVRVTGYVDCSDGKQYALTVEDMATLEAERPKAEPTGPMPISEQEARAPKVPASTICPRCKRERRLEHYSATGQRICSDCYAKEG